MLTVKRGADLLDEIEPGWEQRIDLDSLDLSSSCNCILGQLYLADHPRTKKRWDAYYRKSKELGLSEREASLHGFLEWGRARFINMTVAWRREIQRRRKTA